MRLLAEKTLLQLGAECCFCPAATVFEASCALEPYNPLSDTREQHAISEQSLNLTAHSLILLFALPVS